MRTLLFFGLLAGTLMVNIVPSTAREYPWCAQYGPSTQNCGFVSAAQCRATTTGIGGFCTQNPLYRAEPRHWRRDDRD